MSLPPPPQDDDPIITQFKPAKDQWGLNDNINRIDLRTGETILHNYCERINTTPLEVYRYLIETKGCEVNARDNLNRIPIYFAFFSFNPDDGGDITVLMYLLSQENDNGNTKGWNGNTLLHYACDNIKRLPLDIFKLLIETMGCDVNARNNGNQTPIHLAFHCFHRNDGGNITVLHYLFSQKGIDGNIKDKYGDNLLHMACKYINILPLEIFQHLIETLGSDVNAQNDDKDTPIHLAFHGFDGHAIAILTYLLSQNGINGNIVGEHGYTLLHYACGRINELPLDVFKLLIETMSFDVNAQDDDDSTPLHYVLRLFDQNGRGDMTVLMYLLNQKGINGNIKGGDGYTLLHWACININRLPLDVFKLLIEKMGFGVNVQAQDNDTPIHYALSCFNPHNGGDITVLAYLINQQTVNVNIKGKKGHNLLHLACINNLFDSRDSAELNAKFDTILCQIVEFIAERCLQDVFDKKRV
jgi:ankyrin repeat protein